MLTEHMFVCIPVMYIQACINCNIVCATIVSIQRCVGMNDAAPG